MKRWTEAGALRETNKRLSKIDDLLIDIGGLWGDEDQYIVNLADSLRVEVEAFKQNAAESVAVRAEERAMQAETERTASQESNRRVERLRGERK